MQARSGCAAALVALTATFLCLTPGDAGAQTLSWEINEVYTNADGSIQFIELREADGLDNQHALDGRFLSIRGGAMELARTTLAGDLPGITTAGAFVLVGTASLAGPPFGVVPDYEIPAGFIDAAQVDRVDFDVFDLLFISQGELPTDGALSLNRGAGSQPATPTAFVPEPPAVALRGAVLGVTGLLARRRRRGR